MADASFLDLVVPAAAALVGVSLGAILPYFFTERRNARDRYDAAIAAVTRLQAVRHGAAPNIPRGFLKAADDEEHAKIEQDFAVEAMRRFLAAAAEARAMLAALYPFSPDLREFWDRFEIPESDLDRLVGILSARRKKPTRVYRSGGTPS